MGRPRPAVGAVKVRIGVGTGAGGLDGPGLAGLADDLVERGFDSLWLPEILTGDSTDPLVGLAWAGAHNRRLKLGTTMLLPGRNPVRLAKQVADLDALSGGRFLVTFVPGLARGPERDAIGVPPADRGAAIDEVLPLLRRLWAGEAVTHDGPAGRVRRRLGLPETGAGPVRGLARRPRPGVARSLWAAGRRLAARAVRAGRGRAGAPGGRRRGRGRRPGDQPGALRHEHRLRPHRARRPDGRGHLGPGEGAAARRSRPGRPRRADATWSSGSSRSASRSSSSGRSSRRPTGDGSSTTWPRAVVDLQT